MRCLTRSEADTARLAARLAGMLAPGDTVLLEGDLGAGKSVVARGIARGMGISGPIPSPTFTLMVPHEADGRKLYHFDLYRLSVVDEYYAAGLDEFVGGDGVAVVEWPQMAQLEVSPALRIHLERSDEDDWRVLDITDDGVAGWDPARLSEWRLGEEE